MVQKLPKPLIHAKCGICFHNLTWSVSKSQFECLSCLVTFAPVPFSDPVKFITTFIDPDLKPCRVPPVESFLKVRHLRENDVHKNYFVVFSYIFYPCSLPKNHESPHYHPSQCKYSEESLEHHDSVPIIEQDIDDS